MKGEPAMKVRKKYNNLVKKSIFLILIVYFAWYAYRTNESIHYTRTILQVSNHIQNKFYQSVIQNYCIGMYCNFEAEEDKQVMSSFITALEAIVPIYDFVSDTPSEQTEIESVLTYNVILEKEAQDENQKTELEEDEKKEAQKSQAKKQKEKENAKEETKETTTEAVNYPLDKLNDFDYLRSNFYVVDKTTTIDGNQLNAQKFLEKDMKMSHDNSTPQILIYHTHSQEAYADSVPGDKSMTVVGMGDYLTQLLTEQYGYNVIHHTGEYDLESRDYAYTLASTAIQKILEENPSIEVVIDLHRDGISEGTHLVTDINGKPTAQFMFFNGLSRTTQNGNIDYLYNPYIDDNLAFSFQLQLKANTIYSGLTRKIYLKGYRYNLHFRPKSILVEVGAQTNTVEEARNAMEPMADILHQVLQ